MAILNSSVPKTMQRFGMQQRFQHGLLAISILMLILTGFPIKYSHMAWATKIVQLFGTFENMFLLHKIFAVVMALTGIYHLVWLLGKLAKSGASWSMIPSRKDLKDAIHHFRYLLGLTPEPPPFDRYTYFEKIEYLAVFYGIVVMGLSGVMVWFPQLFISWPRWALDVARVVHTNEAFVCMLAVAYGHFFAVHFNPRVFPTSRVWLDGNISRDHMKEEHPLEYQRWMKEQGIERDNLPHKGHSSRFAGSLSLIGFELTIYTLIFALLMFTFVKLLFM
ncbi:MAG: formate dehydrogenase subunit gamma [Bacillota bacterium]